MVATKKVIVCMSTYNGEKYLKEQIESILAQTYKNITLFVRDDGSTDKTKKILYSYKNNKKIRFFLGNNLGYAGSFLEVLKEAYPHGDYFAFADQDDIWLPNKLERAVKKMEAEGDSVPLLYFSSHNTCNESLKIQSQPAVNQKFLRFDSSVVECVPSGMEMVINKKLADLICSNNTTSISSHDWWAYMVAAGLGKILYDDIPLVNYRRLDNNVSFNGAKGLKLQLLRVKKFVFGGYFVVVKKQVLHYKRCYYKKLSNEDRKFLDLFSEEYSFCHTIKKTFYPKRLRQKMSDEVLLRILFLFGVL